MTGRAPRPAPLPTLLLVVALLLGLACHGAAQTAGQPAAPAAAPAPDPGATTERVHVFLIAPQDGGRSGRKVACGDSAVPVEVTLPRPGPALEGALRALLRMSDPYDPASGLLNSLHASRLELGGVERSGAQARVLLTGYLALGDACENARMLAQLTETALQFSGISYVDFAIDGQPLRGLLLGNTPVAPAPSAGGAGSPR